MRIILPVSELPSHNGCGKFLLCSDSNATSLGKALKISTELVASVVVGSTIGFLLDNWFDTKPLLTICFFIMGVAAGILNVFRSAKKMQKKL